MSREELMIGKLTSSKTLFVEGCRKLRGENEILARLIERRRYQFRRQKILRLSKKIYLKLRKCLSLNIVILVQHLQAEFKKLNEKNDTFKETLRFVLMRLMAVGKLLESISQTCQSSFIEHCQHIRVGSFLKDNVVYISIVSRIWVLVKEQQSVVIKVYNDLREIEGCLINTELKLFGDDNEFPADLAQWVGAETFKADGNDTESNLLLEMFSESHEENSNVILDDSVQCSEVEIVKAPHITPSHDQSLITDNDMTLVSNDGFDQRRFEMPNIITEDVGVSVDEPRPVRTPTNPVKRVKKTREKIQFLKEMKQCKTVKELHTIVTGHVKEELKDEKETKIFKRTVKRLNSLILSGSSSQKIFKVARLWCMELVENIF